MVLSTCLWTLFSIAHKSGFGAVNLKTSHYIVESHYQRGNLVLWVCVPITGMTSKRHDYKTPTINRECVIISYNHINISDLVNSIKEFWSWGKFYSLVFFSSNSCARNRTPLSTDSMNLIQKWIGNSLAWTQNKCVNQTTNISVLLFPFLETRSVCQSY